MQWWELLPWIQFSWFRATKPPWVSTDGLLRLTYTWPLWLTIFSTVSAISAKYELENCYKSSHSCTIKSTTMLCFQFKEITNNPVWIHTQLGISRCYLHTVVHFHNQWHVYNMYIPVIISLAKCKYINYVQCTWVRYLYSTEHIQISCKQSQHTTDTIVCTPVPTCKYCKQCTCNSYQQAVSTIV